MAEGPVRLITGATRGIGAAVARSLARQGDRLFLTGSRADALERILLECRSLGATAEGAPADLTDLAAPDQIVGRAVTCFGRLDSVINNAGLSLNASAANTDAAAWDRVMAVNARAPFFLARAALPWLKATRGQIINIASVVAYVGYGDQTAYTASKHALLGWTRALAQEVQKDGVRVQIVAPGGVDTDMVRTMRPDIDTSELISPNEVAEAVLYLLHQKGNAVTDEIRLRRRTKAP